jgi:error-prone DNA polymerase
MPMGFYQPAQIVIDAQKHKVTVKEVDINYSDWDNKLEEKSDTYYYLRLGFRQIKGLREEDIKRLVSARTEKFSSINQLRDIDIPQTTLLQLADADAFRSIGLDRRAALWEISTTDRPVILFKGQPSPDATNENVSLPVMTLSEHVVQDYATLSLSIKAHPVHFIREKLKQLHIVSTAELAGLKNGDIVKVAGLVLVRQRPGTAKGVVFMTIEDETGTANLVVFATIIEKYRRAILQSKLMMVEGKLQIEAEVIHVIADKCFDLSSMLRYLVNRDSRSNNKKDAEEIIFPEGRNFR